jgi:Xaa-Pro aminopeptidase
VLITDSRFTEAASKESSFEIIEENHAHKRVKILRELLDADGASIVGYEDKYMHCYAFSRLQNALPEIRQWLPLEEQIDGLRKIKTERELELIGRAEKIGDEAFGSLLTQLRPGMTEREAAARMDYEMKIRGAVSLSFDTIMASGVNSSMPHAVPTDKVLEKGDFLLMDFGCIYEGYCSDVSRTIVIGEADARQKEIYQTVYEAQQRALDGIRPGVTAHDCDALGRGVIEKAGFGPNFGHMLGHGVGLYYHEAPVLCPSDSSVIEEGMVLTVEPGIYIQGFGGVRIEDMVVVEKDGVRLLSHTPRELIELEC